MGHTHVTQNQTILKVFIASPSDVTAERDRAINALDEINRTTGNHFNVRLVAVRWELDTYPAIGDDAQSIINSQIQDDYDIFIGIMWVRVGTPTGRALSGTVEEFERAYRRYHNNGCRAPQIMFYFKNAPIKPSHIDSEQISSVLTFKGDISSRGILYKEFDTGDDFETFLRLHLYSFLKEKYAFTRKQNRALFRYFYYIGLGNYISPIRVIKSQRNHVHMCYR